MPCLSYQLCGGREGSVYGGSSMVKGNYQACMAFYQGELSVNRAVRPVRLQDKWVTYVFQISAQWACYFASASNEITLYYCRRQRINKHNIWGCILRSFFLHPPPFSLGSWPLWDYLVLKLGGFSCHRLIPAGANKPWTKPLKTILTFMFRLAHKGPLFYPFVLQGEAGSGRWDS